MKTHSYQNKFLLVLSAQACALSRLLAQAPVIGSISPGNGSPGNSVTVTGANFNTTAGNNVDVSEFVSKDFVGN